jgi:ribulose-5-phosphate 4-epimerase/fuculose-1-phosphate aldolase
MEQRIPDYLRRAPVAVVKGHGPFACGQSLAQCLHYLSVLENSAASAIALRRRGVDIRAIQQAIRSAGAPAVFGWAPLRMDEPAPTPDRCSDAGLTREFGDWLAYIYDLGLGAFGTGSMSRKLPGDEMLFCPMSAAPSGIAPPLKRVALRASGTEPADPQMRLHRLVYARTPFTACILAASPLATAEATATMTASAGGVVEGAGEAPAVLPIDAESAYHKVRLPVVAARALEVDTEPDMIAGLLLAGNGGCLVAGCGVLAAGRNDLGQAAYRISLAERMARFRLEVDLNHRLLGTPPPAAFE